MSRFRGDSWFCSGKTASLGKACQVIKEDCVQEAVFRTFCCVHSWTPPCFWQKWRSQIKMRGFIWSSGFPVSSLLKEKSGRPNGLAMTNHKCMKFHMFSFMRICPRLCGGANSQQDTDLLSNLQALLSHSRTGPDKPQSDDQMLLQSSLVTQAQHKKAGFDLWNALSHVVEPPNWLRGAKSVAKWHTIWRKLRCAGTRWSGWEAVPWSSRLAKYSD